MAHHSNETEAHAFYYQGVDHGEEHSYSGCSLSYDGDKAFSYSTCIAKVIPQKGYKREDIHTGNPQTGLTLVSFFPMSNTTARHISQVRGASPFETVEVPVNRGEHDIYPDELAKQFLKQLEYYAENLNRRENRDTFVRLMGARKQIVEKATEKWAKPLRAKAFKKFTGLDIEKYAEELKARSRKEAARKQALTREVVRKYLYGKTAEDYLEFVRAVTSRWYVSAKFPFTEEERNIVRQKFDTSKSYVWVEDDNVVTSHGIQVPVREVKAVMHAWALGHDMRTACVDKYRIVKYEGSEIQIGCHHIPRENVLALYKVLMGKSFPEKKDEAKDETKGVELG